MEIGGDITEILFSKNRMYSQQPFTDISSENLCKSKRKTSEVEYCFVKCKAYAYILTLLKKDFIAGCFL